MYRLSQTLFHLLSLKSFNHFDSSDNKITNSYYYSVELLFYAIISFIQEPTLQTSPEMMKLDSWIAPYRAEFQGFYVFFS